MLVLIYLAKTVAFGHNTSVSTRQNTHDQGKVNFVILLSLHNTSIVSVDTMEIDISSFCLCSDGLR